MSERVIRLVLSHRALRGAAGSRLGMAAGSSLEFHDYRDYQPGDDVRLIDWNVYARSDRETIRRHREEVAPVLDLVIDASASMAHGNELTHRVADLLTSAANRAGCQIHSRTFNLQPSTFQPSTFQPSTFNLHLSSRSIRILVSDLLLPEAPATLLAPLAQGAAALHVIRVLPAGERHPPAGGTYRCVDAETGEERELAFDAATLAAHEGALRRHTGNWVREIRRFGGTFTDLTAGEDTPETTLRALLAQGIVEVVG